jgi:hypothetical protein
MSCDEMVDTLTNVRERNQWCNTDPARRNPTDCPKFYAKLDDGRRRRCAYDPVTSACTLRGGQVCTVD